MDEKGSESYIVNSPSPATPFPHCLTTELHLYLVADSMERAAVDSKAIVTSALLFEYRLATCLFTGTIWTLWT